jgi:hypothetical protein
MSMSLNDIDKIVRDCLIAYIRGPAEDKTLSYEALAQLGDPHGDLGLHHGGGSDRYTALSKALFHISSYEVEQGRPMLSALVVHKGGQYKGLPGPGFFKLARRLRFAVDDSDTAEQAFWDAQVRAAVEHWTEHEEAGDADAKHAAIMKELATIKRMLRLLVHSEPAVPTDARG